MKFKSLLSEREFFGKESGKQSPFQHWAGAGERPGGRDPDEETLIPAAAQGGRSGGKTPAAEPSPVAGPAEAPAPAF